MIAYIKGTIADFEEDKVIVESQQIGYGIYVPKAYFERLTLGTEVKFHTHFDVREDAMQLFGFLTKEELKLYRQILNVSGIGPKSALSILSTMSPEQLRLSVLTDDAKAISKVPGIGAKTAMKLIIELKDKINLEDTIVVGASSGGMVTSDEFAAMRAEAVQALVALGYSNAESTKVVRVLEVDEQSTVTDLIKLALKNI